MKLNLTIKIHWKRLWRWNKISPKIYFYNKDEFNCLCISKIDVKNRPFIKIPFNDVEVVKINKIFEELIKDFKLYTKRCVAFNCNYNNEFDLRLKKYLKLNKTKKIKLMINQNKLMY